MKKKLELIFSNGPEGLVAKLGNEEFDLGQISQVRTTTWEETVNLYFSYLSMKDAEENKPNAMKLAQKTKSVLNGPTYASAGDFYELCLILDEKYSILAYKKK